MWSCIALSSSDTAYVEVGFVPPFGNRRGSVIDAVHDCEVHTRPIEI